MIGNKRLWYGGKLGGNASARCAICACKNCKPPANYYVRVHNGHLWHDATLCGACMERVRLRKVEVQKIPSHHIPMDIYNYVRERFSTRRAANILKYGDTQ